VQELPIPPHFDPVSAGDVWRVPYGERAEDARAWARLHGVRQSASDERTICLVCVDVQNTFCVPGFELFVAGRSGRGAVDDNVRLCEFVYRNLGSITEIVLTLDTHQAMQIFHEVYLVDEAGRHPAPFTLVTVDDVERGRWRFNPAVGPAVGLSAEQGEAHLRHYVRRLAEGGKYELTIWPYHAMLGGIGHAIASVVEEAVFFHSVARVSGPRFEVKGDNPRTEHYSVLGPEVTDGPAGERIAGRNTALIDRLLEFDAVVIAGQAKSHCVAWTIADLLRDLRVRGIDLARKAYLLEDCTSPVVVPGALDYTDEAGAAFQGFAQAGMHLVRSTQPMAEWPGLLEPR
jgi:nicotinamidase-related amidase